MRPTLVVASCFVTRVIPFPLSQLIPCLRARAARTTPALPVFPSTCRHSLRALRYRADVSRQRRHQLREVSGGHAARECFAEGSALENGPFDTVIFRQQPEPVEVEAQKPLGAAAQLHVDLLRLLG